LAFEDLYLVSTRLTPLDGVAIDTLLAECEIDAPEGYWEFLTRFGSGEVCSFLRLREPDEVRAWRREAGALLLDQWLFETNAEQWAAWGVTFEQFRGGVELWSTNQGPCFFAFPGQSHRVFQIDVSEVVCYERGMIDLIPAVARLMFNMSFPYFEPQRPGREQNAYDPNPGLELRSFVSAVFERWGEGVRCLHSDQDDYVVNVFARQIQARFACYHEEPGDPSRVTEIAVTYDVEHEDELNDFRR
jgi:hypothetical protein